MVDTLRKPFFFAGAVCVTTALVIELGTAAAASLGRQAPGLGIPYLALIDVTLTLSILLMASSLVVPGRIYGSSQAVVMLIASVLVLLAAVLKGVKAFIMLMVMVTLFFTPIFGTLAYLAGFGRFPTASAALTLGTVFTLKLLFGGCLIAAHQRFLQNKGLLTIVLISLLATFLLSLLHGFVPGFLVSIADAIGAILAAILGGILAVVILITSIVAVIKALL
jgi:hypothetical protein